MARPDPEHIQLVVLGSLGVHEDALSSYSITSYDACCRVMVALADVPNDGSALTPDTTSSAMDLKAIKILGWNAGYNAWMDLTIAENCMWVLERYRELYPDG